MDQATSSRIFKPFYTTGKDGRGTGLGLTVVSDIIHTIKGDIRVISEPGRGTVIDVLIPLTQISENHSRRKKTVNK